MRIFPRVGGVQADRLERGGDPGAAFAARRASERGERLGDDPFDPLPRVERTVRILENHLHVLAKGAQFAMRNIEQRTPLEPHIAGIGLVERKGDPAQGRFAGPQLADDAERAPREDRES